MGRYKCFRDSVPVTSMVSLKKKKEKKGETHSLFGKKMIWNFNQFSLKR